MNELLCIYIGGIPDSAKIKISMLEEGSDNVYAQLYIEGVFIVSSVAKDPVSLFRDLAEAFHNAVTGAIWSELVLKAKGIKL